MSCVWTHLQLLQEEEPLCSRLPKQARVGQLGLEWNEDADSEMTAMSVTLDSEPCQDTINTVNEKAAQPRGADAKAVYATVQINGIPLRFQLDTGASCNVIRVKDLGQISRVRLTPTKKVLRMYDGSKAAPKGVPIGCGEPKDMCGAADGICCNRGGTSFTTGINSMSTFWAYYSPS